MRYKLSLRHSDKGFTLIEILITLLVGILVGGLLLLILVNNAGIFYKQSSKVSEGIGSNDALLSINSSIKSAASVVSGYPLISPTYNTNDSTLVLQLPSIDANSEIIPSGYDYEVFIVQNNNLWIKTFPSLSPTSSRKPQDKILANNVSNLLFKYFDGSGNEVTPTNAVKILAVLTLKQKAGIGDEVKVATTEASLRND
jgi:hypothetical protein